MKVLIEKAQFHCTELPFVKGWNIKDEGLYGELQSTLNLDSMGVGTLKTNRVQTNPNLASAVTSPPIVECLSITEKEQGNIPDRLSQSNLENNY